MTILLGVIYPLAITGISQVLFPHQANGSLVTADGKVVGSELIGQNFAKPRILSAAPLGGRQRWLRSHRFGRIELRPDQPETRRSGERFDRQIPQG